MALSIDAKFDEGEWIMCGCASAGVEERIERAGGQQRSSLGSCGLALGNEVMETQLDQRLILRWRTMVFRFR